jgi:hypothetical protein
MLHKKTGVRNNRVKTRQVHRGNEESAWGIHGLKKVPCLPADSKKPDVEKPIDAKTSDYEFTTAKLYAL